MHDWSRFSALKRAVDPGKVRFRPTPGDLFRILVVASRQAPEPGRTSEWAVAREIGHGRQVAARNVGSRFEQGQLGFTRLHLARPKAYQAAVLHLPG